MPGLASVQCWKTVMWLQQRQQPGKGVSSEPSQTSHHTPDKLACKGTACRRARMREGSGPHTRQMAPNQVHGTAALTWGFTVVFLVDGIFCRWLKFVSPRWDQVLHADITRECACQNSPHLSAEPMSRAAGTFSRAATLSRNARGSCSSIEVAATT